MTACKNIVLIAGMACLTAIEVAAILTHQDGKYFEIISGLIFTMATGGPHVSTALDNLMNKSKVPEVTP